MKLELKNYQKENSKFCKTTDKVILSGMGLEQNCCGIALHR